MTKFCYGFEIFAFLQNRTRKQEVGHYVPLPKVRGDILVPVGIPGVGVTVWYPPYLLNQWVEFNQTCMDTSLGQAKELIKFW